MSGPAGGVAVLHAWLRFPAVIPVTPYCAGGRLRCCRYGLSEAELAEVEEQLQELLAQRQQANAAGPSGAQCEAKAAAARERTAELLGACRGAATVVCWRAGRAMIGDWHLLPASCLPAQRAA